MSASHPRVGRYDLTASSSGNDSFQERAPVTGTATIGREADIGFAQ